MQHDHVLKNVYFDPIPEGRGGGMRAKYLLLCCCMRHFLLFDMQNDIILKKLNFDLLTPTPGPEGGKRGCLLAKYLLLCCCIRDSLKLDTQHYHILQKLNFDLLTPPTRIAGTS